MLVCPGRNAVVEQVTGAAPPDYPDRDVAARFAAAGLATLTLDYGFDGSIDPERLYGRDEAAVLAQVYLAAGRSLLAELVADATAAFGWLRDQPWVRPDAAGLFGHSLGAAVALHVALSLDRPPPLCTASHLGSYRVLRYGHPALMLPGIGRDLDLTDLYAALAPAPLQVQYGRSDRQLDPADAEAAGQRIQDVYRLAGAEGNVEIRAEPMGHGTATTPAIEFFRRTLTSARPAGSSGREPPAETDLAVGADAVPLLRAGRWYTSLDQLLAPGPGLPPISLAPEILLRSEARRLRTATLPPVPDPAARAAILTEAIQLFVDGTVDCGGLGKQSAAEFRAALWRTAGLPAALTDRWCAMLAGRLASLVATAPAHDPDGHHRPRRTLIWLPANTFTCLESVLAALWAGEVTWIRPSTREPLSALRLVSALLQAGWPAELIGFYPAKPNLLSVFTAITDRQVVYGGAEVARSIGATPSVELHGPMRVGAVVTGPTERVDDLAAALLPLIAGDAGRFCTAVRAIFCPAAPDPLASHLAGHLAALLDALPFDPPGCLPLAASADPALAEATAAAVTSRLGSADQIITSRPLLTDVGGVTYLAPALVRLADPAPTDEPDWGEPPLLGFEAPFPLVTIMRVTSEQQARLTGTADLVHRLGQREDQATRAGARR